VPDGLIVTLESFKAHLGSDVQKSSEKDGLLLTFLLAAEEMVRSRCSQNFDQRAYASELHSGRDKPFLWARQVPVAASPLPTVTENGTALVVAAGYSSSAQVVFNPATGCFTRMTAGARDRWLDGNENVALSYTGGYASAVMPADLQLLVKFIAALTWQTTDRNQIAVKRRSGQQGSTDFWDDLPPFYQSILNRYSVPIHGE
jgi:hypothetical protein